MSTSESVKGPAGRPAVAVRSNTVDMKEHLRHLGPSNAANKPRATKFSSVKIKPGVGTIPEGQATTTGVESESKPTSNMRRTRSVDVPSSNAPVAVDEEDALLRSAGKDASDGAAALRQGYGTVGPAGPESPQARGLNAEQVMSPGEASQVAEQKAHVTPDKSSSSQQQDGAAKQNGTDKDGLKPGKFVVGLSTEEDDVMGEMGPARHERSKSRGARSGSITETTVDINGMKKTVLEATSSSSDDEATVEDGDEDKQGGKK